jgi:hypothetical protein
MFADLKRYNLIDANDTSDDAFNSIDDHHDGFVKYNEYMKWMGVLHPSAE